MKKHVFTGVFIPAKIWMSKELTPQKKMILAEIKALSEETGWCFANNGHFAEWLGCGVQNVSNAIQQLQKDGMIEVTYMDQRTFAGRKIRVNMEWYHGEQHPSTENVPPYIKNVPPYTGNVTPYTGSVTEIQSKYNNKEVVEEKREEKNLSTVEAKPLLESESTPAAPAQNPAPFAAFDIDRAAASLTTDYRCIEQFRKEFGCDEAKANEKHPIAVAEFVEKQKAVMTVYHNDRDFRQHYFSWLPKVRAAKKAEAQNSQAWQAPKSGAQPGPQYRRLTA